MALFWRELAFQRNSQTLHFNTSAEGCAMVAVNRRFHSNCKFFRFISHLKRLKLVGRPEDLLRQLIVLYLPLPQPL